MSWFVYIIESSDESYYTGITTDLERRFKQHASGNGAKFFKGRRPVKIVYQEDGHSRSSATKREAQIKSLSKKNKEQLINSHA